MGVGGAIGVKSCQAGSTLRPIGNLSIVEVSDRYKKQSGTQLMVY
jgi:hypothetical protein